MTTDPFDLDRLYDLLADRATVGLTAAEASELSTLLPRWPHVDPTEFDRAAAALNRASHPDPLPVPPDLMAKLQADAEAHFGRPAEPARSRRTTAFYWAVCGWSCAATVLVGFIALQLTRPDRVRVQVVEVQPKELSVAEKRERFKADPTAATYASAIEPGKPSGTVLFSAAKQEGYMELKGLTPNDPTESQYQLWVVDKGRTFKEPVDGGVFDVKADGTALVPVRSPLELKDVALFAVTVEPPGGVVVSEDGKKGKFVVKMSP
jgi:anti-sigma-K factor RskA